MSFLFPHRRPGEEAGGSAAQELAHPAPATPEPADAPAACPDRACCCPAWPVVEVLMPATATRRAVDLWLCGHHWRVSRGRLAAAGASFRELAPAQTGPAASEGAVV